MRTSRCVAGVLYMVLAAGTVALCAETSSQPARRDADIRVMSFNIRLGGEGVDQLLTHVYGRWFKPRMRSLKDTRNYWRNRRDMVVDVIRRYDPDLIGLQEANRVQLDDIRPGGLGVHFIHELMDQVEFLQPSGETGNILQMKKQIEYL